MTASCMTCIYSQLTKEQYPCSECYYDNNGNPSKHEPVVEAPDINVGNMDTTTHDSILAETGKNNGDRTSGDCISRKAAIDALLGITAMRNTIPLDSAIFNIKKLPSAQPEIIRCKDCAYCDSDVVDSPYEMTKKVWWCDRLYAGANENLIVEPDDFCSYAKRRTDE